MTAEPRTCRPVTLLALGALLPIVSCAVPPDPDAIEPIVHARFDPGSEFQGGMYLRFDDFALANPGGAALVANGNLSVSWADAAFDATVDGSDLDTFDAEIGVRGALALELAVDQGGAMSGAVHLATVPLPAMSFAGDVQVTPHAKVRLELDGTADAGARVSIVAPFDIPTVFSNDGPAEPSLSGPPSFAPEIGLPDAAVGFDGTVKVVVTVAFLTTVNGVPIGGPVIASSLGTGITVAPIDDPWLSVEAEAEITGGWADPLTGLPIPSTEVTLHGPSQWPIPQLAGPLIGVPEPTRWSTAYDIAQIDAAAALVVTDDDQLVVVEDGDNPWMASLYPDGEPSWQHTAPVAFAPTAMVSTLDGDLVVAAASGDQVRLDRHDPSTGAAIWTRTLTVTGASSLTCEAMIPSSSDAGVVVVGEVERPGGIQVPFVAKLDAAGDVVWATEIDAGAGSTDPVLDAIAETSTGDLLAVGSVVPGGTSADALVVRLDAQGVVSEAHATAAPTSPRSGSSSTPTTPTPCAAPRPGARPAWCGSRRWTRSTRCAGRPRIRAAPTTRRAPAPRPPAWRCSRARAIWWCRATSARSPRGMRG